MKTFYLFIPLLLIAFGSFAQSFTEKGATAGLNLGGSKEGGAVWADFDNDGDLDVAINTDSGFGVTYLYQNNGDGTFTDVTSTYIAEIGNGTQCCERSIIWGDLNNDGFIDLIGNTYYRIEIYLNRGTGSGYTDYSFGVDSPSGGTDEQIPNQVLIQSDFEGSDLNAEGIGLLDYNNDGWLDIVLENDQYGIDILENDQTGIINTASTFLSQATLISNSYLGLPSGPGGGGNKGDYIATGDYNNDGYMDILARKHGGMQCLWTNDQDGTFSANTSFTEGSSTDESNKGGAIFCDFDSDGDFDIFWTDHGTNQIWLQHPTGTFTATSKPTDPGLDIDGCACGDVDNDGDTDLFLGDNSGSSYLFINSTSSPNSIADLSFSRTDIAVNANAEGVNLVDYDNDGDVDIYINADGSNNQLWENDYCQTNTCNFFKVVTQDCIDGSLVTRPVVGATMVLKDDGGNIVNAAQDMNAAMGHGAQNPAVLNFTTPDPAETYTLEITFPAKIIAPSTTPTVETYSYDFIPNTLSNDTLILTSVNASDGSTCDYSLLPIELLYFKATFQDRDVLLKWATASETNNDFFSIERSNDGRMFYEISQIKGAGNSSDKIQYAFLDNNPLSGWSYYRLKQTDYDGVYTYSQIILVENIYENFDFEIYPNPAEDELQIQWQGELSGNAVIKLYDISGNLIQDRTLNLDSRIRSYTWPGAEFLDPGIYIMEFNLGEMNFGSYKIIKQ